MCKLSCKYIHSYLHTMFIYILDCYLYVRIIYFKLMYLFIISTVTSFMYAFSCFHSLPDTHTLSLSMTKQEHLGNTSNTAKTNG